MVSVSLPVGLHQGVLNCSSSTRTKDGRLPRLRHACELLADVRNAAFKVGGAVCLVCIDCGGYPTTEARDQQRDCFCRLAQGVGG